MSENQDDDFKRLFAQAPLVGADDAFVARVAEGVAMRRRALRTRRGVLLALACAVAVLCAVLLAPMAPSIAAVSALGDSLLNLPDRIGNAAGDVGSMPGALYLWPMLAAVVLPLAGVAWLSRRAQ